MIAVISYGVGNVSSLISAYLKLNIPVEIISNPKDLKENQHIILPGVGRFDNAMSKLNSLGFIDPLNELVSERRVNILGICVGLQMMGLDSQESPSTKGLGWIDAKSIKLRNLYLNKSIQLPHMGWNTITQKKDCPLLTDIGTKEFYFLHSYALVSDNTNFVSSESFYGSSFISSFSSHNIYGTQFHPEKSHTQGLGVLKNFAETKIC